MEKKKYLLVTCLLVMIFGCNERDFSETDQSGIDFVIGNTETIRDYLRQTKDLTEEELEFIEKVEPNFSVYMWGTGAGAFSWSWDLPNNRHVGVNYYGGINVIDPNYITYQIEEN